VSRVTIETAMFPGWIAWRHGVHPSIPGQATRDAVGVFQDVEHARLSHPGAEVRYPAAEALERECPACGAAIGLPCAVMEKPNAPRGPWAPVTRAGLTRRSPHVARRAPRDA